MILFPYWYKVIISQITDQQALIKQFLMVIDITN